MITLSKQHYNEAIHSLKTKRSVTIRRVGVFHITEYVKKNHPKFVLNKDGSRTFRIQRNKKCRVITFRATPSFKNRVS